MSKVNLSKVRIGKRMGLELQIGSEIDLDTVVSVVIIVEKVGQGWFKTLPAKIDKEGTVRGYFFPEEAGRYAIGPEIRFSDGDSRRGSFSVLEVQSLDEEIEMRMVVKFKSQIDALEL